MNKIKVLFIYRNKLLSKKFMEHFIINNYEVYELYENEIPYYKLTFWQRLENIFYRVILKQTEQIHKINERNFINHSKHELRKLKNKNLKFDFCFVIRGDLIPEVVLKYANSISDKMIDYQLDGLSVSSKILNYKKYFDQIYVFDESDIIKYPDYQLKPTTNCFFEDYTKTNRNIDFLYIGVLTRERKEILSNLYQFLHTQKTDYNSKLLLIKNRYQQEQSVEGITFLEKALSYEECLKLSQDSTCVIDIKRKEHDGLSLRFFEALNYRNKIITNNNSVKKYDFYHPNNIFITDFNNFDGLEEFLKLPYFEIDKNVIKKYNFKYWIKNIFGLD